MLTTAGPAAPFAACTCSSVAGLAMFWRIRHAVSTPALPGPCQGILAPIALGLSYVRRRAPLTTLLPWVGLHCSLTMASIGILPAVATANLRGDVGACGLLLTGWAPTRCLSWGAEPEGIRPVRRADPPWRAECRPSPG